MAVGYVLYIDNPMQKPIEQVRTEVMFPVDKKINKSILKGTQYTLKTLEPKDAVYCEYVGEYELNEKQIKYFSENRMTY